MSAGEVELRPMRWWHLDEVAALEAAIFGATAWSLEQFYAEVAASDRWVQVLVDGDRVTGYVDVAIQGRDADLMTIAVAADAQGRGLGCRMLTEALRAAGARGAHHMFLEVASNNPAQRMYANHGFTVIDRRHGYYSDGADAVIMRAALAPRRGVEQ